MEIPSALHDDDTATAVNNNVDAAANTTTLTLVPPTNPKSPYWVHYQKYHPVLHPTKTKIAVCNYCQKEISVGQGTAGLKSHLKCKHREVYANFALTLGVEVEHDPDSSQPQASFPQATAASVGGASANATTIIMNGRGRRGRQSSSTTKNHVPAAATAETVNNDERRKHEKHLMEMWSYTRREIHVLRQELKNSTSNKEDDEDVDPQKQELENDLRRLMKRKAEYAAQLGMEE